MSDCVIRRTNKETLIKMMEENPVVIDGHTKKSETITGLVEFVNPDKQLACCWDARYYSLNACTLNKENKLYCSTCSIGGVLFGAYPDAEALKTYNEGCLFEGGKIKCIHRPDGTKVYPAE